MEFAGPAAAFALCRQAGAFFARSALAPARARPAEIQNSWAARGAGRGLSVSSLLGPLQVAKPAQDLSLDSKQRAHFYGHGDPDHVPSILQNITAQRYEGGYAPVLRPLPLLPLVGVVKCRF